MFTSTKKILEKAAQGKYAVGHFNFYDLETLEGIVQAAEKLKSPVIIATSEGAIKYAGMEYLFRLAETAAGKSNVPLALHLDHGKNWEIIQKAVQKGYSSVMVDASHLSFEENVKATKSVVRLAHQKDISVEAELGTIGDRERGVGSKRIIYTSPSQVQEFVERTGCDFLAVAIGTSHGAYKFSGKAKLRMDLLKEIKQKVKIPLVLHGASRVPHLMVEEAERFGAKLSGAQGIPDAQVKQAIKWGISKVNIDTDLRIAFTAGTRKALATRPQEPDPRLFLSTARDYVQKTVEQKIKLLGSLGKAKLFRSEKRKA